jgi:HK97 family phage major capsid protein
METIRHTVNQMVQAFEEFKTFNSQRLETLENKSKQKETWEEKMHHLNKTIEQSADHLKHLHIAQNRLYYSPESEGQEEKAGSNEYKTAFHAYIRKGDETGLLEISSKSLSSMNDADGGYLIPQVIHHHFGKQIEDLSPLRRLASVMTISGSAVDLLVDKNVSEVGWVTEIEERKETPTPQLNKIRIPVHELYAKPRATQKLLEDASIDIETWLSNAIASKIAQAENYAFVAGDGQAKPKGFMSYPTAAKKDWIWGTFEHIETGNKGAFTEDAEADTLIDCVNALKPEYHKGAVWVMSRSAHAVVRKIKDRSGHYLWQPSLSEAVQPLLLGYPVEIVDEMPPLVFEQESAAIAFGNFKEAYQIVDRTGLNVLRDPFSAKPYVEFYATKRVGGDVINFEALKIIQFR